MSKKQQTGMKYCKDCRWFMEWYNPYAASVFKEKCFSPGLRKIVDEVYGPYVENNDARFQRGFGGDCGMVGLLFEKKHRWWRFWE